MPLTLALAVGLGVAILGLGAYGLRLLDHLENRTIDARFSLVHGPRAERQAILIVGVDRATQNELGRAPLRRSFHARMIDVLRRQGARTIAYDLQFTKPTAEREDLALMDAVARTRRVVLATGEVGRQGQTEVFGGNERVRELGATVAYSGLPRDSDGTSRRLIRGHSGLKTLSVAVAETMTGRPVTAKPFGDRGAWINFQGPPRTFPTLSFADVLAGRAHPAAARGKIVIVGYTDPLQGDVHPAPATGGVPLSGPEVQANAIATVLEDFPLRSPSTAVETVLIALLALIGPVAAAWLRAGPLLVLNTASLAAFVAAAGISFRAGHLLPLVYPVTALVLGGVGALGAQYLTETRERRRIRSAFLRFVPQRVMEEAIERWEGDLRTGGRELTATVMFSDLRGFTSFAESLPAVRVIEVLNRYLTEMSGAISAHGGTVVDFMGDGIMAVFGAPVAAADHADCALAAAREMLQERLPQFNDWLGTQGLGEGFRMGIGLNSGSVISGNVGSESRVGYTAVGDTTNTAARLEAMTKDTPYELFIADSTRSSLQHGATDLTFVDQVTVRGRQGKIGVWSLPVKAGAPGTDQAAF